MRFLGSTQGLLAMAQIVDPVHRRVSDTLTVAGVESSRYRRTPPSGLARLCRIYPRTPGAPTAYNRGAGTGRPGAEHR